MKLSQKPLMKYRSNTISTYKARNKGDCLCAEECYTIKKNTCKIHRSKYAVKKIVITEICELYNIFLKSYNTVTNIEAQLYIVIPETTTKWIIQNLLSYYLIRKKILIN
jgi:hypothetical protein